ncbi:MAG: hypothetical protein UX57_C0011G0007 [Candidatus Uhrbacteria bacterium GW2011_GWE2_46_68]|uniref:Uncharacterized protein n=2 Tax=Candidatus Uhriibacteriota TaxID=1752732 RepID=A0A0G1Q6P5_9BACT|nr:MAG: hypothetical protein UX45_C0013G0001 [Candidatus Uhrbacteria bacterium GW2011_GWF2_46_218]KKU40721.1 MAG: hypothetical protein UX57_C0011G0007 [Candidatus Uhrbacteria bacterium GW2011_GWE2_46_68]
MRLSALVLSLCLFPTSAMALDITPQVQIAAGADAPIANHLYVRASTHLFWLPGDHAMTFAYTGVIYSVSDHFWVAPQIGVVANWNNKGDIAPLGAVWAQVSNDDLRFFFDVELFPTTNNLVFYGYYNAEWMANFWFGIGLQGEQVDLNVMYGPHLAFALSNTLVISPEYYYDPINKNHTFRWVTILTLN